MTAPPSPPAPAGPGLAPGAGGRWQGGFSAIQQGAQGIIANPVPAIIFIALSAVLSLIFLALHVPNNPPPGQALTLAGAYGEILASLIFLRAMAVYQLSIADKRPLSVGQLFAINVKQFFSIIGAAIVVGFLVLISGILLFIPLIWLLPSVITVAYVVVDKGLGPLAALKESHRLGKHRKGKAWQVLFWVFLLSVVGSLIGRIPYLNLITLPAFGVITASLFAIFYRWLEQTGSAAAAPTPTPPPAAPAAPAAA